MYDFCLGSTELCPSRFLRLSVTKPYMCSEERWTQPLPALLFKSVTSIPNNPMISFEKNRDQWFLTQEVVDCSSQTSLIWFSSTGNCCIHRSMWWSVYIPGGPKKTEQSIQSIFQDFALINSYLFSPCWIEHLFLIIITPRSSNLVENFLFYE